MPSLYGRHFTMSIEVVAGEFDGINGLEIPLSPTTFCLDVGPPEVFYTQYLNGAQRPANVYRVAAGTVGSEMTPVIVDVQIDFDGDEPDVVDPILNILPFFGDLAGTGPAIAPTTYNASPFLLVWEDVHIVVDDPLTNLIWCAVPIVGETYVNTTITVTEGVANPADFTCPWSQFVVSVSGSTFQPLADGDYPLEFGNRGTTNLWSWYSDCSDLVGEFTTVLAARNYWIMNVSTLGFAGVYKTTGGAGTGLIVTGGASYVPVRPLVFEATAVNVYTLFSYTIIDDLGQTNIDVPAYGNFPSTVEVTFGFM